MLHKKRRQVVTAKKRQTAGDGFQQDRKSRRQFLGVMYRKLGWQGTSRTSWHFMTLVATQNTKRYKSIEIPGTSCTTLQQRSNSMKLMRCKGHTRRNTSATPVVFIDFQFNWSSKLVDNLIGRSLSQMVQQKHSKDAKTQKRWPHKNWYKPPQIGELASNYSFTVVVPQHFVMQMRSVIGVDIVYRWCFFIPRNTPFT